MVAKIRVDYGNVDGQATRYHNPEDQNTKRQKKKQNKQSNRPPGLFELVSTKQISKRTGTVIHAARFRVACENSTAGGPPSSHSCPEAAFPGKA